MYTAPLAPNLLLVFPPFYSMWYSPIGPTVKYSIYDCIIVYILYSVDSNVRMFVMMMMYFNCEKEIFDVPLQGRVILEQCCDFIRLNNGM